MFFASLCSSSGLQCQLSGSFAGGILFDAGIGIRNYQKAMCLAGVPPESVRAICVTPEHSDPCPGLACNCG